MDVLVLSRNVAIYSTRRLTEAFRARGRGTTVLDPAAVCIRVGGGPPGILVGGEPLSLPSVAVPRIGAGAPEHAIAVLMQLEALGVPLVASGRAVSLSRDKTRSLQALAAAGLPVPETALVRQDSDIEWAVSAVGGPPVVLKFPSGTHGVGVILAESLEAARTVIEAMWGVERNLLVQRYVAAAKGSDARLFVVGDRVVAAIRRTAPEGELRSNLHLGGTAEPLDPGDDLGALAVEAARALGLRVAGVDLLEAEEGPLVTEVNASPGLEGIEDATGVDVAGEIAEEALRIAARRRA